MYSCIRMSNIPPMFLVCFSLFAMCHGLGNGSGWGRSGPKPTYQKQVYNGLGYANGDYPVKQASVADKPPQEKGSRGIGLSAWGIIAVLSGSLFLITVIYYVVLFYPILCKKERKYDIMDLNSV